MPAAMEGDKMEMERPSWIGRNHYEQGPEEFESRDKEDYLKGKERLPPHRADLERYNTDFPCFQLLYGGRCIRAMEDPSSYIGNDNELEVAHAGIGATLIDLGLYKIITGGTHAYKNDVAPIKWLISSCIKSYMDPSSYIGNDNELEVAHAGIGATLIDLGLYKIITGGTHAYKNDVAPIKWLISSCIKSYMDSFYNSGNGNELKVARAGRDSILKDDLAMEQYKEALGHIMGIPSATFTNSKRMGTVAAINSCPTGGDPMQLVLDSGASSHVVGNKGYLKGYQRLANPRMGRLPDNSLVSIVGVGTIQTEDFSITNVSHVEGLAMNLISVSQLDKNYGMGSWFLRGQCYVMLPDGTTAGEGTLENGVYVLSKLHVPAGPVMEA